MKKKSKDRKKRNVSSESAYADAQAALVTSGSPSNRLMRRLLLLLLSGIDPTPPTSDHPHCPLDFDLGHGALMFLSPFRVRAPRPLDDHSGLITTRRVDDLRRKCGWSWHDRFNVERGWKSARVFQKWWQPSISNDSICPAPEAC